MNKAMDRIMTPLRRKGNLRIMSIVLCFLLLYLAPVSLLNGADAIKIKVASIYAHTGVAAAINSYSIIGVREAVEEINARGGVMGRRFELIEIDNMSTPIGSKVAAEKAIAKGVTAIIGSNWSSHTLAIAPVAQANKTPLITNISTNEGVTKIGDYIFRVCFTDSFQGKVMAKFAREDLKAHSAVMIIDLTSDYSMGLARDFKAHFEQLGGKVEGQVEYKLKAPDFERVARQAKALNPQVVFIPGYDESALIIKDLMNIGVKAIPLGGDGWESERFFEKGGGDIPKGYYSTHWTEGVNREESKKFIQRYKQKGKVFNAAEALAYDAVLLLADAIKRSGSFDRTKIRDALAATKGFQGVTGTITFNSQRDPIKSAVIIEIKDGKQMYLKNVLP
jgi:branched-chain amino acid transport system substrate-binding protein